MRCLSWKISVIIVWSLMKRYFFLFSIFGLLFGLHSCLYLLFWIFISRSLFEEKKNNSFHCQYFFLVFYFIRSSNPLQKFHLDWISLFFFIRIYCIDGWEGPSHLISQLCFHFLLLLYYTLCVESTIDIICP